MKKVYFLVAVFLIGITTQTFSQRRDIVVNKQGNKNRYYNSQEIRFVENGVLYSVTTDGAFTFQDLRKPINYRRGRRDHKTIYYNNDRRRVLYTSREHGFGGRIFTNHCGQIIQIGKTLIDYNWKGKVISIGTVPIRYRHRKLVRVGHMKIFYDRYGSIRFTEGYVNRFNKRYWHKDWYRNNSDWKKNSHDRIRTSK